MKNTKNLPCLVSGLGLLAYGLRFALYAVAVDEKNLLVRGHPLEWVLYLTLAAAAAAVLLGVKDLGGTKAYAPNFGPSGMAALGSLVFGGGLLAAALASGLPVLLLDRMTWAFGLIAGIALVWTAWDRRRGKAPFFLLPCAVCAYMALYMVSHYQTWSSNPQLQDYLFSLLAVACMTLFAYEQAAFALNLGSRRRMLAVGLLGAFGCLGALAYSEDRLLYLTGAVWCLTNLCRWEPLAEAAEEMPEEESL